ncbi:helix-turn-helix transcriptional regulator [Agrobacterium rosae]|uniref:helix-turn-helix transcriptional regulator n=1 Tax=Agrobacterium rosae TaxID=1972867 RepID=UPI002550CCA6|nr:AlpA family phage regulatory protein [Agrobacterium rosae]MCM2436239.1 AlpA family phage regulatory protein [Agrobacterium rosae]
MTDNKDVSLISVKEVCKLTSLSRTMITNLRAQGRFPAAVSLGERRILWLRHEIQAWILEQANRPRVR